MFASLDEVTGGNALLWNEPQWQRRFSADLLRNRMHEKLLVVDGEKLVMGGMNVADDYLQGGVTRKGWHDTDLLVEGPAAAEAQKVFLKLWELSKYLDSPAPFPAFQEPETKVLQKLFYQDDGRFQVRPTAEGGKTTEARRRGDPVPEVPRRPALLPRARAAPRVEDAPPLHLRQHPRRPQPADGAAGLEDHGHPRLPDPDVPLVRPPLRPVPDAARGLPRRAREGREGRASPSPSSRTPSGATTSGRSRGRPGPSHYQKLIDAGVHLFEWQGHADLLEIEKEHDCTIPDGQWPGRTIHSKVAVVDGQVCLVGSHNFNVRSESFNNESAALFQDAARSGSSS